MGDSKIDETMQELIELGIESLKCDAGRRDWEFGEYGLRLKSHFFQNEPRFGERFFQGYQVLLDGLNCRQ